MTPSFPITVSPSSSIGISTIGQAGTVNNAGSEAGPFYAPNGAIYALGQVAPNSGAAGNTPSMFKSTDGGKTWNPVGNATNNPPNPGINFEITYAAVLAGTKIYFFAMSVNVTVMMQAFETEDNADTWGAAVDTGLAIESSGSNVNRIAVGYRESTGHIFVASNWILSTGDPSVACQRAAYLKVKASDGTFGTLVPCGSTAPDDGTTWKVVGILNGTSNRLHFVFQQGPTVATDDDTYTLNQQPLSALDVLGGVQLIATATNVDTLVNGSISTGASSDGTNILVGSNTNRTAGIIATFLGVSADVISFTEKDFATGQDLSAGYFGLVQSQFDQQTYVLLLVNAMNFTFQVYKLVSGSFVQQGQTLIAPAFNQGGVNSTSSLAWALLIGGTIYYWATGFASAVVCSCQLAFHGVRRIAGRSPLAPKYDYTPKSFTYKIPFVIDRANVDASGSPTLPIVIAQQIHDYDFELHNIQIVYENNDELPAVKGKVWILDQNRQSIMNIPALDVFVNALGYYKNGALVPPLFYQKDSQFRMDFYSLLSSGVVPVNAELQLVGIQRYPK